MAPGPPWLFPAFAFVPVWAVSIPSAPSGQRGVTPAFGYGAPHLSARGTSTLPNNALLSTHYQRIRLPLWRLPFSGMVHIVRHTRSALSADQDHSGSPRSLGASLSERAVLPDPAAVSGHLAICGVPTGACQPLRCCRPAGKYFTRLNSFTFVTARASLCLRLVRFVTSRTQDSIPGEAAPPLNGAGISPAGSTRFSLARRNAGKCWPARG